MRWLPLLLVTVLVVGVLVAQDPEAVGLQCAGSPSATSTAVPAEERVGPCEVRSVIDGDTLDVSCEGRSERVRMLRIDTPERDEPGYTGARQALRRLVANRDVHLVFEEPERPVRDPHGRLLAYVYSGERNLCVEMVGLGWSRFDRRFGAGRFAPAFAAAEQGARAAGRGVEDER